MRRADRLFAIIQELRRKKVVTARELSEHLMVSERTIYRDVQDLSLSGTPIEGEAGVGYRLRPGYELPPLMFTREEVVALAFGAKIAARAGGPELAHAARTALTKIEAVLDDKLKASLKRSSVQSFNFVDAKAAKALGPIRKAIDKRRKMRLVYVKEDGSRTERTIWPYLALFWGQKWTLSAYCELRQEVRNFRLDRIAEMKTLSESVPEEGERHFDSYLTSIGVSHPATFG